MELGRLQVIIDVGPSGSDPVELVRRVIDGGAPFVQIRAKRVTDRVAYVAALRIVEHCRANAVQCVINDRADIALAVGADGCHVGEHDLAVPVVRGLLGASAIVGGTARNPDDAARHAGDGATYVGVGPVYATTSKAGLPEPIGIGMIRAVSGRVAVPVFAISGVTLDRVPELMAAGAYGVAVIGAIARAEDPCAMTAMFMDAISRCVGGR